MIRVTRVPVLGLILALALSATAVAKPRRSVESVSTTAPGQLAGIGCSTASFTASVPAEARRIIGVSPAVGAALDGDIGGDDDASDLRVTDVTTGLGRATWTIGPTPQECASGDATYGPGGWSWSTYLETFAVDYLARGYAIEATLHDGVESIAGFRVSSSRRYWPTIRKARRAFGSASRIWLDRYKTCHVHWRRLGIAAIFVNFGIQPACRHGFLQTLSIRGPNARDWIATVDGQPGVAVGTSYGSLDDGARRLARDPRNPRAWTLADRWLPYGDAGYFPTVSAVFAGRGPLRRDTAVVGFELYIGAGGD